MASAGSGFLPAGTYQRDVCWVCLEEESPAGPGLTCPCACPRPVHPSCLARWQLHSAGTSEETICRFCHCSLPDWKGVLSPSCSSMEAAMPTMSVTFNGQIHHVLVRGGPGGYEKFVQDIRDMFAITEELDMHLAFDCADPVSGQLVKLNGSGAFQAAVHCATISAAKRLRTHTPAPVSRSNSDASTSTTAPRMPPGREAAPSSVTRQTSRLSQEAPMPATVTTRAQARRSTASRRRSSASDAIVSRAIPMDTDDAASVASAEASLDASTPLMESLLLMADASEMPTEADVAALGGEYALDTPAKCSMLQTWLERVKRTLTEEGGAALAASTLAASLTDPVTAQLLTLQCRIQNLLAELQPSVSTR